MVPGPSGFFFWYLLSWGSKDAEQMLSVNEDLLTL